VTEGLFQARKGAELATQTEKLLFHSTVAKMPHLAEKTLPDLLLTVSYLATRVSKNSEDDLQEMKERGLLLSPGEKGITMSV
jgi:hypothetical protein